MNVIQTTIPGVLIIEPKVFTDARGYRLAHPHRQDDPLGEGYQTSPPQRLRYPLHPVTDIDSIDDDPVVR